MFSFLISFIIVILPQNALQELMATHNFVVESNSVELKKFVGKKGRML